MSVNPTLADRGLTLKFYRSPAAGTGVKFSHGHVCWLLSGGVRGRCAWVGWVRQAASVSVPQ